MPQTRVSHFFPTGVVGSSELRRCAGLRFHMKNNRFHNFTLHDYITHRLHDYTTTILRLLSSLYIYILAPHSCLPSFKSYLISPTSSLWPFSTFFYLLLPVAPRCSLLSALYSLLTPLSASALWPSCRSSLLAALCYLLSDHPIFSLSTLPLIVL